MSTSEQQQVSKTAAVNTPLQQQLDEIVAQGRSQLPTELLQQLLSTIERLLTSGAAEQALKNGAQVPDFTLPDALGNTVTLSHLLKRCGINLTACIPLTENLHRGRLNRRYARIVERRVSVK